MTTGAGKRCRQIEDDQRGRRSSADRRAGGRCGPRRAVRSVGRSGRCAGSGGSGRASWWTARGASDGRARVSAVALDVVTRAVTSAGEVGRRGRDDVLRAAGAAGQRDGWRPTRRRRPAPARGASHASASGGELPAGACDLAAAGVAHGRRHAGGTQPAYELALAGRGARRPDAAGRRVQRDQVDVGERAAQQVAEGVGAGRVVVDVVDERVFDASSGVRCAWRSAARRRRPRRPASAG